MTSGAPDAATLLAGLADIRLPPTAASAVVAEALAALGLGLLLALCLAPVLRRLTAPRPPPVAPELERRLARLDGEDRTARHAGLVRLAAEMHPEILRARAPGIYRPDGLPDADVLERELRQAAR